MKDILDYRDGMLFWKHDRGPYKEGSRAGSKTTKGYRRLEVSGVSYYEHRVIWELHNGVIPEGMHIDHINCIKDDNRIENLRLVTVSQNLRNRKSKGYAFHKQTGKYLVRVCLEGKRIHLGYYEDEELADLVAKEAQHHFYGEHCYQRRN